MLEALRQRLQAHQPLATDHQLPRAAVLIALIDRPEPTLLLTRRASHLSQHPGQVAFPGGKAEPDDSNLLATALREAEEEVALPSQVSTVADLLAWLKGRGDGYGAALEVPEIIRVAIDHEHVDHSEPLAGATP